MARTDATKEERAERKERERSGTEEEGAAHKGEALGLQQQQPITQSYRHKLTQIELLPLGFISRLLNPQLK